jgi:hypothetical protein
MFFLALHTGFWLIFVFLIEFLKNIKWIRNLINARDPGPSQYDPDDDVEREKERVGKLDPNSVAVKVDSLR